MNLRLLQERDREQAIALWRVCFPEDSDGFVEWFFQNRFAPDWAAGLFAGERLLSVIHGKPMRLLIRGRAEAALMVSGVGTLPECRGQGCMRETMLFLKEKAGERGIRILFNHPQKPGAYRRLGFVNATDTLYWQGQGSYKAGEISAFNEDSAYAVYQRAMVRYSGSVIRSRAEFALKMADYDSDGGRGFMALDKGEPVGYAVYFSNAGVYGEEVLSLGSYEPILFRLKELAGNLPAKAKLPPDAAAEGEIRPQNVMLAPKSVLDNLRSGAPRFCVDEY